VNQAKTFCLFPAKGGTLQPFAPLRVVSEAEPQGLFHFGFFRDLIYQFSTDALSQMQDQDEGGRKSFSQAEKMGLP